LCAAVSGRSIAYMYVAGRLNDGSVDFHMREPNKTLKTRSRREKRRREL